jgi:cold-inducible RNA-binding protein
MSNRLYVGNLPFHATEDLIQKTFATSGQVTSVSLVLDRTSGQSRGFCFVEMANADAAQKAITDLDGKPFGGPGGRPLRVSPAQDKPSRSPRGGR